MKSIVHCKLPKAGLGNQLFPLMKAAVFAHLNELPLIVTGYHQIKLGPYLRREQSKRRYAGYFNFQKLFSFNRMRLVGKKIIEEPRLEASVKDGFVYRFSVIPSWSDYFSGLKEYRPLVKRLFHEMLTPRIISLAAKQKNYTIGLHVRMGDFKPLAPGTDFAAVGSTRTPASYFIDVLCKLQGTIGVFSDGYPEDILRLPNTTLVKGNPDIVDMIILSRSKVIIPSAGSTFSYWAAFLSDDAPVIMHPDHLHGSIRNEGFEGPIDKYLTQ